MAIKQKEDERHEYTSTLVWTGARKGPTISYETYSREYEFHSGDKPRFKASADPHFRGDRTLYNPEDLVVMALSSCHLLSYLAECAWGGVHVVAYEDDARGVMSIREGKLRFTEVVLRPRVTVATAAQVERARELHHKAHEDCYVANSVNFPVHHEPTILVVEPN
jgi:organic hydroperoxide reductase OsmC/OhrA